MTALRSLLFGSMVLDRSKIIWRGAIRGAIVVTILITVPVLYGAPATATPLAIGALFVALADIGEQVGLRWRTMLWTTTWLMAGTFVGILVSENAPALVVVSALVALLCGYVGVIGRRSGLAGVLTLVIFTVFAGSPRPEWDAPSTTLLVGLGGIIITAVTIVPTLIRHPGSGRRPTAAEAWLPVLRQHLHADDDYVRHAVRLALAIAVATIVALLIQHPHSYWIPMTVAWVAKPERRATSTRVLARLAGTIGGVLIVVLINDVFHLGNPGLILVCGIGSLVVLMFVWADYAIAVVGITAFIVALFALQGSPVGATAHLRIGDTLIAGVIAVLASLVWPAVPHPDPAPSH